jgi:Histidine kinase-, DNA gyrase B-, and HSP90-like ATPase
MPQSGCRDTGRVKRQTQPDRRYSYEQQDWQLFIDKRTLPQKAGCEPRQLGRVVLKELVDNALDAGASSVTLSGDATSCTVADDGPGIEPDQVPWLFAVNRPLISSKLKRLPTRGMLGNGLRVVMGAVAALGGKISVTTRRRRYDLGTNTVTGATEILSASDVPEAPGVMVEVELPESIFNDRGFTFARRAIEIAGIGKVYDGPSMPSWYGKTGLEKVLRFFAAGLRKSGRCGAV